MWVVISFIFMILLNDSAVLCTYHRPSPGGGTPGKGGDFVKDPVKVLIFPLLGGDTEESKFPSLRGITLSSLKPDKKTVLYTLNEMSCFNSAYMFVTMQISMYCLIQLLKKMLTKIQCNTRCLFS